MSSEHPLGALISGMRRTNGWTYEAVAREATKRGFKVSKSAAQRIETVRPELMRKDQIEWLSAVFGLGERQIIAAFMASMGYTLALDGPSTVEDAVRADTRLSSDEKEVLLDVVRGMRRRAKVNASPFKDRDETATEPAGVSGSRSDDKADTLGRNFGGGAVILGRMPAEDPTIGVQDSEDDTHDRGV